jgi:hypothetical protein
MGGATPHISRTSREAMGTLWLGRWGHLREEASFIMRGSGVGPSLGMSPHE